MKISNLNQDKYDFKLKMQIFMFWLLIKKINKI